jgi:hypothetical protein
VTEHEEEVERIGQIKAEARRRLAQSDYVIMQATERGLMLSSAWRKWREDLRSIVKGPAEEFYPEPERFTDVIEVDVIAGEPEEAAPTEPPEDIKDLFSVRTPETYEQTSARLVRLFSDAKNKAELANSAGNRAERLYWERSAQRFNSAIMWFHGRQVEVV